MDTWFQEEGDRLRIDPCIPKIWDEFTIHYRYGSTLYSIRIKNSRERLEKNLNLSV